MERDDFDKAAAAWDTSKETLDDVNLRIHDGVPVEQLVARADAIVSMMYSLFEFAKFKAENILEIGSGVGFLMEAVERRTRNFEGCKQIIGLDISESMIEKARERLANSIGYQNGLLRFASYDGTTIPFDDCHFDFIYSVAALQHIPKPYVYNLFFEIKRTLKETGFAILQFLPFSLLRQQDKQWPWRREIQQQIGLIQPGHWHHYYSSDELECVLKYGTGFPHFRIKTNENLWVFVSKTESNNLNV